MANTHRGWFSVPVAAGVVYDMPIIASMIQAGSALGGAYVNKASVAFPFPSQFATATFNFEQIAFRLNTGSGAWTSDPVGTPNASTGIPMYGSDTRPIVFPGHVEDFTFWAGGAGILNAVIVQGHELEL